MQITERKADGLKHGFDCVVAAADVQAAIDKEISRLGKQVKIAGFRPGHVPAKILKQRYGADVSGDVVKHLVTDGVTQTINDNKLRPALQPVLEKQTYSEGADLAFSFTVEVLPDVPDIALGDIKINRATFTVTDEDVERGLAELAERSPEPQPLPAGTKAKTGNVLKIDFVGSIDGKKFEGGTATDFSIEIGSNSLIAGFEEQLIGLKAGDEKTVSVSFPDNYFSQNLAGKPAVFEIKVNEVCALKTPEISDAFAISKGFSGLRALKEALRDQMNKEFTTLVRTRTKKALFDALEERCIFPIPQGMFDVEFGAIWQRVEEARKKGDEELATKSEAELREEYTQIAKRRVALGIYLAEIGRRKHITVSREELSRALISYASNFPGQEQRVLEFYRNNPQALDELRGPILEEKAVDWIFTQIQFVDAPISLEELEKEEVEDAPVVKKPAKSKKKKAE